MNKITIVPSTQINIVTSFVIYLFAHVITDVFLYNVNSHTLYRFISQQIAKQMRKNSAY